MKIIIKTKNLELTKSLSDFIDKRVVGLKKLAKFLRDDSFSIGKGKTLSEVFIEIEKETKHHKKGDIFRAEAIINLPKKKLVAKAHGENLGKAVTKIRSELEREIKKYKTKIIALPRRKYRKIKRENIDLA